jgi:hypothetical protein
MRTSIRMLLGLGLAIGLASLPGEARGGRFGGGGGGGRGGGFSGGGRVGGFSGGYSAPAARSSVSHGGSVHGPYGGSVSGSRQVGTAAGPHGSAVGARAGGTYTGPRGGAAVGGHRGGTATTPGGATISGGSRGGAYTGPRGSVVVGGAKGGAVTGPGGNTVGGAKHGAVVIGPNGNVHATGGRHAAAVTPGGAVAGGRHGAVTAGPGGVVASGGRGAVATGPGGTVAGGRHGAVAVGPHGAAAAGRGTVAGRTAGGAFVGTRHVSAAALQGQGAYVRHGFTHYHAFSPVWRVQHPGAWFVAGWTASTIWNAATWGTCSSTVGYAEDVAPVYYDYGETVTYQDGNVYYDGQVVATEAEYAQQATQLADAGQKAPTADEDKWQALGVFAMTKGDETTSNDIFQLALNQAGVVRGNYYNATTDAVQPVAGSLDKKTQRLAWSIGDKKDVVYETGLYNLTLAETTLLAHFGKDRTEQYNLFRIEQPTDGQSGQAK